MKDYAKYQSFSDIRGPRDAFRKALEIGLIKTELKKRHRLFATNERIEQIILYESRAVGNYKTFSDIDITLIGNTLTRCDVNHLMAAIDESSLPYQFDLSLFNHLNSNELKEEIQQKGIVLYQKSTN